MSEPGRDMSQEARWPLTGSGMMVAVELRCPRCDNAVRLSCPAGASGPPASYQEVVADFLRKHHSGCH